MQSDKGVNIWLLILRLDLWQKVKYKYGKIKKGAYPSDEEGGLET